MGATQCCGTLVMALSPVAPPPDDASDASGRLRAIGGRSLVYLIADGLLRMSSLLLVPFYTRALQPSDYGILGVTIAVTGLTAMLSTASLEGALGRLYFEAETEEEKRSLYGSVLGFVLSVPLVGLLAIEALGSTGKLDLFNDVPYDPYLRYAVWTGYLSGFGTLLIAVWVAHERAQ